MSFDLKLQNGDLVIKNGQLQTVVDTEKLIQDVLKLCLTTVGADPLHPWYGSFLSRTMVGNPNSNQMIIQIAKSQLNTALENLKSLQELQIKSFQRVSAEEQISAIMEVSVVQNQVDPTLYDIKIKILSKGLKPVNASFRISTI
jgi:phage baseplate assembly protein W